MEILRLALLPLNIYIPLTDVNPYIFVLAILMFAIVTGFLAGLYPAFYLTHFRPAEVLKGRVASGFRSGRLRNALVVFQFSIAIALMAGTVIVFQQLNFFLSADVGFDKNNLITITRGATLGEKVDAFRNELLELPGVTSVSVSTDVRFPAEDIFTKESDDRKITLSQYKVDEHFVHTSGLRIAAGRTFDEAYPADRNKVIINEAAAQVMGWTPEEALGKKILYVGDGQAGSEVIGVLKNFHFQNLYQANDPTIFYHIEAPVWGGERVILVRYTTQNIPALVAGIEGKWSRFAPESPIEYSFFDDDHRKQYEAEQRMGTLFFIFTTLALIIAVVGLVGLVSYSAEQRKKEIGIRKVFGASLVRIYLLLNVQYVRLIAISLFVATPVTWVLMQRWLDGYAYRIDIRPWVFLATGAGALLFALVCVGYIALRAASTNPSNVLKDE
jgi:putative ABC transport system permease protein